MPDCWRETSLLRCRWTRTHAAKVPPIFAAGKYVAVLRSELAVKHNFPLFKLCSTGITSTDHQEVGQHLSEWLREYYTHDAPGCKPFKELFRGLPEHAPEEIISELRLAKLKPQKVFPIRKELGSTRRRATATA